MIEKVLAIETSCDDTSVAIVDKTGHVISLVSASQDLAHEPYGGIVPEIASRNHSVQLLPLIDQAFIKAQLKWEDVQGLAVTNRPGLVGALIVGLVTAKSLSQAKGVPFIGVNHLEGHLLAPFLKDNDYAPPQDFQYPYIALAVSGGHTSIYRIKKFGHYEVLGSTKDDAVGEAFDKFAKMVGLGFPGGVRVDQWAKKGNPKSFEFPRSMINDDTLNMSFSGLKSAAARTVQELGPEKVQEHLADLCASFQEAIVDVLLSKLDFALKKYQLKRMIVTGGVSANSRLREKAFQLAEQKKYQVVIPPIRYCTDNAAMIGYVGIQRMNLGEFSDLTLPPFPQALSSDFKVLP